METLEDRIWDRLPKAWLAWGLLGLLVVVYVYVSGLQRLLWGPSQPALLKWGAVSARHIDNGELWRLSSSLILHGGLLHLLLNGLALLALCRMGEAIFGSLSTLGILYLSGWVGAFFSWSVGSPNTVGASGAIFGLLSALSIFGWKYRSELSGELGETLRKKLGLFGLLNLFIGLWIPMIDNPSHFGGCATGIILGLFLGHREEKGQKIVVFFWGSIFLFGILITFHRYF